ncbi:DUF6462 family protein [Gemmiger sp.]
MRGTVWMFSDQIDDEDIDFMHREFVTYNMARIYYGLGMKPVIRMSHECGAIYKIGRKVLIRRSIFEEYLRSRRKSDA